MSNPKHTEPKASAPETRTLPTHDEWSALSKAEQECRSAAPAAPHSSAIASATAKEHAADWAQERLEIAGVSGPQPAKAAHTPGPWAIEGPFGPIKEQGDILVATPAWTIAKIERGEPDRFEERQANARLIAAAPETAAELERVKQLNSELEQWKASAMSVEATWNEQEVARLLGVTLGSPIRSQIQPKIEQLLARLAAAEGRAS